MNVYDDLLKALREGFKPFNGAVAGEVYAGLGCRRPERARWLALGDVHLCLGCEKRCAVPDGAGFQRVLPVDVPMPDVGAADIPSLTADQMLHAFKVFKPYQVQFILNISRAEVYQRIADGRLVAVGDGRPVRVTRESILAALGEQAA